MNKKIVTICVLMLVSLPVIATASVNESKTESTFSVPIINGPKKGTIGEVYEYTITYEDPSGEDVYYQIIWGDCAIIKNDGPHKSGEVITRSHAWCEICCGPGDFTIRVKATNENEQESNWGKLDVTMNAKGNKQLNYNSVFGRFFEKLMLRFPILGQLLNHFPFFEKILNQITIINKI